MRWSQVVISSHPAKRPDMAVVAARPTSRGDLGLFATQSIPKGTNIIYRWNEEFYKDMEGWAHLCVAEVLALPEEQRALFHRYGLDEDFDKVAGPLHLDYVSTLDNYINHACEPNLHFDSEGSVVTSRDLAPDEELSIDYGCFTVNFDEDFQCNCGARNCRGAVTKNDWMGLARKHGYNMPRFLHKHIHSILNDRKDLRS